MAILLTRRIPSAVFARLQAAADVTVYDGPTPMTADELKRRLPGIQSLICVLADPITAEVLDAGRDLKVVSNIAVGYENIDVTAARARGIVVTNTPDVLTEATADLTWGLILTVTRRIAEGDRLVRRGDWKTWALDFMLGMELRGKQLGIIGAGRIGRAVAAKAAAFGMHAVFASREHKKVPADVGPSLPLDELLISSDVLSIHAPATKETRHLIDRRALARMKRSAFLINAGRGSIVDEEALAWALNEHLIAGAGLDVYEREPTVFPDLLTMENVVLSPHLGSATRQTRAAMADLAVSNALAVLEGQAPLTPV
jgi:glyoxylate reductase